MIQFNCIRKLKAWTNIHLERLQRCGGGAGAWDHAAAVTLQLVLLQDDAQTSETSPQTFLMCETKLEARSFATQISLLITGNCYRISPAAHSQATAPTLLLKSNPHIGLFTP